MSESIDISQSAQSVTEGPSTVSAGEKDFYKQRGLIRTHNLTFHALLCAQAKRKEVAQSPNAYGWQNSQLPQAAKAALEAAIEEHPEEAQDIVVCNGLRRVLPFFLQPETENGVPLMYGISAKDLTDEEADFLSKWLPLELNGDLVDDSRLVQEAVANKFVKAAGFKPGVLSALMA